MAHSKKNDNDMYQCVLYWYASFIPLGVVTVLGILCFLYETELLLYLICGAVLLLWVVWFMTATKKITHKDGYTFVQAMAFYTLCEKNGVNTIQDKEERNSAMQHLASQTDYAASLKTSRIQELYRVGENLTKQFRSKKEKSNV